MLEQEYDREIAMLQTVLERAGEQEGERSGFVQRRSKVTGANFVQMMVLGCLERADVSLTELVAVGEGLGVRVSAPGLDQRIDAEAVVLLRSVLQAAVAAGGVEQAQSCAAFGHFPAVHLQDSTYISLPAHMAPLFRGSGGNASTAAVKVWLDYEYRSGTIAGLEIGDGCRPDQACRLTQSLAAPGSLHIFDLGFCHPGPLAELASGGSYFVCRHQQQTALYALTPDQHRIDLETLLATCPSDQCDFWAELGAQVRLPVRILCQRVPQEVADLRRAHAKADAKRMRRTLSPRKLQLMDWNIFCTNVPAAWWSLTQVLTAYRVRWQIELLFKLWKSTAGLDRLGDWRTPRVLCQFYARLIALVIAHALLAPSRFAAPRELSLPKAFRLLQRTTPALVAAIAQGWQALLPVLRTVLQLCRRLALKDTRRKRPSTYQLLCLTNV